MTKTYYIGLDVHKDSIAIAYTHEGSRQDATFHGTCGGTNLAAERALRGLAEKLGVKLKDLKVCYEAGPSGFVLARRLRLFPESRCPLRSLWSGFVARAFCAFIWELQVKLDLPIPATGATEAS